MGLARWLSVRRPGIEFAVHSRGRAHDSIHDSIDRWRFAMLMTIFFLLLILWVLGVVSANTLGGFLHLLLVVAIGVVLIRIIQGRRPV